MSKEQQKRYIYVRNDELSKTGFVNQEDARIWANSKFEVMDTEERRVRVRLRNRTGLYDVVVKTRREAATEKGD